MSYDGKINTTYIENKSSTFFIIVTQAILYGLYLIITQYFDNKRNIKRNERISNLEEEVDNKVKESEKTLEILRNDLDSTNEEKNILNAKLYKLRLYYMARMQDYSKELDFWKNTIRKFLYQCSSDKKNEDKLFDIVTKELKTYGTKDRVASHYDEINYLAKMMRDIENDLFT